MLTIYGVYKSRATRTLWMAEELGIEYNHIPVIQARKLEAPLAEGARVNTHSPAYTAINPMGAIPTIDDDGFVLSESLAINLYLAKKYGAALGPQDLAEESLMIQWALFVATEIEGNALKISTAAAEGRMESEAGKAEVEAAARLLRRPFAALEAKLSQSEYLVGDRFTAADINAAEVVRYAQPHAPLLDAHPHVRDWLLRCQARPAFQAMWEARANEVE